MPTETLNVVEAKPNKTIEVVDSPAVHAILTNLSAQVQEQAGVEEKFQTYLKTFAGKANLGIMAGNINRDFTEAQKGRSDELARKLGLTTLSKAREINANLHDIGEAQAQEKVAQAERAAQKGSPTKTAKNTVPEFDGHAHDAPFHLSNVLKQ